MSADIAFAAPLLMLILLTIAQFALWSHAKHIAQTAASEGLSIARADDGTAADGEARAREAIAQFGDGPLRDVTVHAIRTAEQARVEVTGIVTNVVPFVRLPVRADATGPVERFIADSADR